MISDNKICLRRYRLSHKIGKTVIYQQIIRIRHKDIFTLGHLYTIISSNGKPLILLIDYYDIIMLFNNI